MSSSSRPKAVGAGRTTTSGNLSTAVTGGKVQRTGTDSVNHSTEHSTETSLATPVATDSAGDAHCTSISTSREAHAAAKHAETDELTKETQHNKVPAANHTEVHTAAETADEKHSTSHHGQDAKDVQSKGRSHVVPPMGDADDAWTLVSHDKPRRPKRKVINNLKAGTTEKQLATYLHSRIAAAAQLTSRYTA